MRSTLILGVALAVIAAIGSWRTSAQYSGEDFYLHWCVARTLADPQVGDIYSAAGQQRIGALMAERAAAADAPAAVVDLAKKHPVPRVIGSPFLYATFAAVCTDDYERDYTWYRALSLLCTLFGVLVLARIAGMSWGAGLVAFSLFTLPFEPFLSIQRTGNVSQFQLAALAVFLLLLVRTRHVALATELIAGVLLGALLAFKINLAAAAVLLVFSRLFTRRLGRLSSLVIGTGLGVALAVLAADVVLPQDGAWRAWQDHVSSFLEAPRTTAEGNYSVLSLAGDVNPRALTSVVFGVLLVLALGLEFLRGRRFRGEHASVWNRRDDLVVVGLGAAIGILGAPIAWLHYYNLSVPLALWCIARSERAGRFDEALRVTAGLAVLAMALTPWIQLRGHAGEFDVYAGLCYGGLTALLVVAWLRLWTADASPTPDATAE